MWGGNVVGHQKGGRRESGNASICLWPSSVANKDNVLSLNQHPLAPSAPSGTAEPAGVWLSARPPSQQW